MQVKNVCCGLLGSMKLMYREAVPLKEVFSLCSHSDTVLTAEFSPTQIALGCLSRYVSTKVLGALSINKIFRCLFY